MDEALLDVARSIRPYLPSLIGTQATSMDRKLAALLRRALHRVRQKPLS